MSHHREYLILNKAVDVIAVPPNVSDPDTSKLPFKSTVVAASCISVSATRVELSIGTRIDVYSCISEL